MTDIDQRLRLLAETGRGGEADDTTLALDALADFELALVRQHLELERRVAKLEGNDDGSGDELARHRGRAI